MDDIDMIRTMETLYYSGSRSYWTACHLSRVVAGLVAATSIMLARCSNTRGRRDKPGDDGGMCDSKRSKSAVGAETKYVFSSVEQLMADFWSDVWTLRGDK
jgi:hypothetical protein